MGRVAEGLDGDEVDEGSARRVLLVAGVVDGEPHGAVLGLEGPGVGVPAALLVYTVWMGRTPESGVTDTFSASAWAHDRAAVKVME